MWLPASRTANSRTQGIVHLDRSLPWSLVPLSKMDRLSMMSRIWKGIQLSSDLVFHRLGSCSAWFSPAESFVVDWQQSCPCLDGHHVCHQIPFLWTGRILWSPARIHGCEISLTTVFWHHCKHWMLGPAHCLPGWCLPPRLQSRPPRLHLHLHLPSPGPQWSPLPWHHLPWRHIHQPSELHRWIPHARQRHRRPCSYRWISVRSLKQRRMLLAFGWIRAHDSQWVCPPGSDLHLRSLASSRQVLAMIHEVSRKLVDQQGKASLPMPWTKEHQPSPERNREIHRLSGSYGREHSQCPDTAVPDQCVPTGRQGVRSIASLISPR